MLNVSPLQKGKTLYPLKKGFVVRTENTPFRIIGTDTVKYKISNCCVLTFWPGQKCHSKVMHRKEVTHSNGSYERKSCGRKLADEMGRAKKFPWYIHRLMHRKRVTSELHDSYFRLMTIKHSISKIEWASNDNIIQLSSTSQLSCRQDVVGKATPGRRGLGPWWVEVRRRCW